MENEGGGPSLSMVLAAKNAKVAKKWKTSDY